MSFMICITSTAKTIVSFVELIEWGRGIIGLHSKAKGYTVSFIGVIPRSITTSIFSFTLCHSKTLVHEIHGVVISIDGWVVLHCGLGSSWHVLQRQGWY